MRSSTKESNCESITKALSAPLRKEKELWKMIQFVSQSLEYFMIAPNTAQRLSVRYGSVFSTVRHAKYLGGLRLRTKAGCKPGWNPNFIRAHVFVLKVT